MYSVKVVTTNSDKNGGGYHEIHISKHLRTPEHCFDVVSSIIKNSVLHCDENTLVTNVEVLMTNVDAAEYIEKNTKKLTKLNTRIYVFPVCDLDD